MISIRFLAIGVMLPAVAVFLAGILPPALAGTLWESHLCVHMRARGGTNYGAEDAHVFLDKVVPVAPDVEIIVAHLGASGPRYSSQHDEKRVLYGSDLSAPGGSIARGWEIFRTRLPLTPEELQQIANNHTRFAR